MEHCPICRRVSTRCERRPLRPPSNLCSSFWAYRMRTVRTCSTTTSTVAPVCSSVALLSDAPSTLTFSGQYPSRLDPSRRRISNRRPSLCAKRSSLSRACVFASRCAIVHELCRTSRFLAYASCFRSGAEAAGQTLRSGPTTCVLVLRPDDRPSR